MDSKRRNALLHSKYHLCSLATRALLLTTYVKFINLFPEIKTVIEDVFNTLEDRAVHDKYQWDSAILSELERIVKADDDHKAVLSYEELS